MSTFSGLLVSMTGALAHDIYGRILRPRSTPEQRMRAFKICARHLWRRRHRCSASSGRELRDQQAGRPGIRHRGDELFPAALPEHLVAWHDDERRRSGMLVGGTFSLAAIASTMFADQAAWAQALKHWYAAHPLLRILAEQPAIWALPLAIALMILDFEIHPQRSAGGYSHENAGPARAGKARPQAGIHSGTSARTLRWIQSGDAISDFPGGPANQRTHTPSSSFMGRAPATHARAPTIDLAATKI